MGVRGVVFEGKVFEFEAENVLYFRVELHDRQRMRLAGQLKAGLLDSLGDPGLWQTDQMQTVERFVPDGNRMQVIVTMTDPTYYVEPFTTTFNYLKLPDGQLLTWDCTPEEAGYDRFKENAPKQPLPLRNREQ